MTAKKASSASFLAAAISLPIWVLLVLKLTFAFVDDANPAGIVWFPLSIAMAIPFGWIIGRHVATFIYKNCNLRGFRRYGRAVMVHALFAAVVATLCFIMVHFELDGEPWSLVMFPVIIAGLFSPMLGIPSLIGTLVYADWSLSDATPQFAQK